MHITATNKSPQRRKPPKHRLPVWLSPRLYAMLTLHCDRTGLSMAEVARLALSEHLGERQRLALSEHPSGEQPPAALGKGKDR